MQRMPAPAKENPRNEVVSVAMTRDEKEAIRRKAEETKQSMSDVAREMMLRGSLSQLVASFFGPTER